MSHCLIIIFGTETDGWFLSTNTPPLMIAKQGMCIWSVCVCVCDFRVNLFSLPAVLHPVAFQSHVFPFHFQTCVSIHCPISSCSATLKKVENTSCDYLSNLFLRVFNTVMSVQQILEQEAWTKAKRCTGLSPLLKWRMTQHHLLIL